MERVMHHPATDLTIIPVVELEPGVSLTTVLADSLRSVGPSLYALRDFPEPAKAMTPYVVACVAEDTQFFCGYAFQLESASESLPLGVVPVYSLEIWSRALLKIRETSPVPIEDMDAFRPCKLLTSGEYIKLNCGDEVWLFEAEAFHRETEKAVTEMRAFINELKSNLTGLISVDEMNYTFGIGRKF